MLLPILPLNGPKRLGLLKDAYFPPGTILPFMGRYSLLNTDQGIRGFLAVTNDLSVECRNEIGLGEWVTDEFGRADDLDANFVIGAIAPNARLSTVHRRIDRGPGDIRLANCISTWTQRARANYEADFPW